MKFWIKDGFLAKDELTVSGSFERDGETRGFSRTTTTEIKPVGTAKLEIPDEAAAKLPSGDARADDKKSDEAKPEEKKEA